MGEILYWIPRSIGYFLNIINDFITNGNYGFAIIILTVIIRLLILPLTIKQLKSTTKMQAIQPRLKELQDRYKNDPQKLYEEQAKLYKKENVSMFSGCMPLLIQMPILFSLFYAISQPLKYQFGVLQAHVNKIIEVSGQAVQGAYNELMYIINNPKGIPGAVMEKLPADIAASVQNLSESNGGFNMDMNFFGINLGETPKFAVDWLVDVNNWPLILLAISAGLFTWLSMKVSMARVNNGSNGSGGAENQAQQMTGTMNKIMPIMTMYFAFIVPAAMTLYWVVGYIIQIIQQLAINKIYFPKEKKNDNIIEGTVVKEDDMNKKKPTKQYRREQHKKNGKK